MNIADLGCFLDLLVAPCNCIFLHCLSQIGHAILMRSHVYRRRSISNKHVRIVQQLLRRRECHRAQQELDVVTSMVNSSSAFLACTVVSLTIQCLGRLRLFLRKCDSSNTRGLPRNVRYNLALLVVFR
jgi:hypothetical protein